LCCPSFFTCCLNFSRRNGLGVYGEMHESIQVSQAKLILPALNQRHDDGWSKIKVSVHLDLEYCDRDYHLFFLLCEKVVSSD
jgi:hypothetical protein